ncbi:DJ-1/PfpI family protein [uncultured Flavonifractor sp.]|uniref:DJ-1/PfpI family protein n=1 Tax=uncultured Flavonifractor sp. TaxID=1193534 RepID=UPI00260DD07A|nr:DJ-1/PfpI family protein [uncultured Flavonifractor sp.]
MRKFAVLLYPNFSLQEITCLTSTLAVWFGEKIDYLAAENKEYVSEEGLRVIPTKTVAEVEITDYDCVILPGTIDPLPALFDDQLIDFLKAGANSDVVFAAISSSPILLSKAGVLRGKKFTSGYFMQMADTFAFVEKENFIHKGIVEDRNVITGIGWFFKEFAEAVLRRFGHDIGNFLRVKPEDYSEEKLTFYWSDDEYKEFLEELKKYTVS